MSLTAIVMSAFMLAPLVLGALAGRRHRYEVARAAALMSEFATMVAASDDGEFAARRDSLLAKLH